MPESRPGPWTICHVDAERKFSGGEVQVFLLMQGLRAAGHRSILIAPPGSESCARARRDGFEVREVALRSDLDFLSVIQLTVILRELNPDLVHLHTGRAAWLGGLAARQALVPAIVTRRMDRRVRRGWRTRLVYGRLTRAVAAISDSVAHGLIEGGVAQSRIVVIHSSIDPAAHRPERSRAEVRSELGVGVDEPVVLMVGSLVLRKGHGVLFDALARLAKHGLQPSVWLAGEGSERAELERQAAALAPGQVRFLGQRRDVADLLAAADIFAMPSLHEGLGVAALEALQAGCAVVASRVGGLAEVVEDGVSGLLVPPADPASLAEAVEKLIRDPGLRARLAEAGRARIHARYRASAMVAGYEALYRRVLAEGALHPSR
ncbi:MAG TPA: glycosyltransferase [Planctomycetota bacterium]|nr:glycosyltransferase [Planctomycetota bacterium]